MPAITVTRNFSVCPLLEIEDPEFAHWYGFGVFWALLRRRARTRPV